ncbi:hypothetical protein AUR04nite_21480 [Glutamicibacter uratoxydans]|uniref:Uncharacterized protein n=1 Tax=Glutamicibacter uratoxydans TaxID=43667 RepID=A0A4Y4DNW6_GLUUR|nr:hypothetical protein AUR04nite_21480 [Glutamicibacter uratoxydans]
MGNLAEGAALALADVAQNVADFMTEYYHFVLLLLGLDRMGFSHIAPTDNTIDSDGLLDHKFSLCS